MRGTTLTVQQVVEFFVEDCCSCGVVFAMTIEMRNQRLSDKQNFYCPNGHHMVYTGKSNAELEREVRKTRELRDAAEAAWVAERDQRLAAERELKRHTARTKAAACPCCNRTFVQLARHLKSKHPNYVAQPAKALP